MSLADAFRHGETSLGAAGAPVNPVPGSPWFDSLRAKPVGVGVLEPTGSLPVRCSSLPYFCARESAIREVMAISGAVVVKEETWAGRWRTSMGTAIHAALQERMGEAGLIVGRWRCRRCDSVNGEDLSPYPAACHGCGAASGFSYVEKHLEGLPERVSGHVDGLAPKEGAIVEIKSCGEGTYRNVAANGPTVRHLVQGAAYAALVTEAGLYEASSVRFVYVPQFDASAVQHQPPASRRLPYELEPSTGMMSFLVQAGMASIYLRAMLARVAEFRRWRSTLETPVLPSDAIVLPDRLAECPDKDSAGRWRYSCPVAEACFAVG